MLLAVLNVACKADRVNQYPFSISESRKLSGTEIAIPLPIMSPKALYLLPGNLIILDKYDNELATWVPIGNPGSAARVFRMGNGPNEFLKVSDLFYDSGEAELKVVDGMSRKVYTIKCNQQLQFDKGEVSSVKSYMDRVNVFTLTPFCDGYWANGSFETKMFTILDEDLHERTVFGDFPGNQEGLGTRAFFLKNQTVLAADPSGQYVCAAGVYTDWIVIYRIQGDRVTVSMESFRDDADLEIISHKTNRGESNAVIETDKTRRTYRTLYAGEHYLYALYWGVKATEIDKPDTPCYVVKYSYEGEQIDTYSYNKLLYSIAVDEAQRKMYAITYSPEEDAQLLEFKI